MKGYIRQRTKGAWEITIDIGTDPATGRRRRHFETIKGVKREAQNRLARLMVDIEHGSYVKQTKKLTAGSWLLQWYESYVVGNLSLKTGESYQHELLNYIVPYLGGIRLTELRPHHIQGYVSDALSKGRKSRPGGLSHRTVQYHYRILSKAFDDAIKMGLLNVNPCKGVTPPRPERHDIPAVGPDELARLINAMKQSSYFMYFYTLLLTGLRRSELLALKWRAIDLELASMYISHSLHRMGDGRVIIKDTKTSRSRRVVDLSLSIVTLLREYKEEQEVHCLMIGKPLAEDDFVFSNADGSPLNPNTVTHTFAKVAKRAGMELRLHDLRHIHATMLLKAGVHPRIVQERLGHSSIATTLDIYSHTVPGLQKAAAERIDALLPKMDEKENVGKMSAEVIDGECEPCRARTCDTLIKSQVLCQLS
jgi:integrase